MVTYQELLIDEYTKNNMRKYGVSWFKFDEDSGNALDSKSSVVGTVAGATRILGRYDNGYAMNFDGNDEIVLSSNDVILSNTIKFDIKTIQSTSTTPCVIGNSRGSGYNGVRISVIGEGVIQIYVTTSSKYAVYRGVKIVNDGEWHNVMVSWDGSVGQDKLKLYIDYELDSSFTTTIARPTSAPYGTIIGRRVYHNDQFFIGQIDNLESYNEALTLENFILNKSLILHDGEYKKNVSELKQHPIDKYTPIDTLIFKDSASNNQIVGVNGSKINVVNGVVTSSDGVNRLDNSLYFNGTSSIHLDSPLLPIGDKTVDFYFSTTMTGVGTFFSTADGSSSTNGFLINISSGKINMAMKVSSTSWNLSSLGSINSFNDGKWHNARFVFKNGAYIRMYVDGILEHNTNHSLIETTQGYNLSLGARAGSNTTQGSNPTQFVGNIANFRVYNTAITDDIPPLIESFHWNTISSSLPTSTQFLEQGMDNLSPLLDRKVTELEPMPMMDKSEILDVGEIGKVFSKTIDLKKYFDIRSIRTEVR